jgi:hypothetical protein
VLNNILALRNVFPNELLEKAMDIFEENMLFHLTIFYFKKLLSNGGN